VRWRKLAIRAERSDAHANAAAFLVARRRSCRCHQRPKTGQALESAEVNLVVQAIRTAVPQLTGGQFTLTQARW
jgi:hypothetical protein